MSSNLTFVRGQHAVQALLCLYGGIVSYNAITNLQKYEKTAEKLADWSKEAAKQLRLTRTTQAAGAVALLTSFVASFVLGIFYRSLPKWLRMGLSPVLLVGVMFARSHMKGYWAPKDGKTVGTRVPLPKMEEYNEAQRSTENLLTVLEYLEYSWVASSVIDISFGR